MNLIKQYYPLIINQIYYDNGSRAYHVDVLPLEFPAFIKKSQVKFNFKTQNKPYAVIQDLPDYVSAINRSYDLEFEVIGDGKTECIYNYKLLHEFLKLMKTNFEKTRNLTVSGAGSENQGGLVTSYALNNAYISSRANFRINLESNPYIYNLTQENEDPTVGNIYDILMTSFDYKIDDSHGYFDTDLTYRTDGEQAQSEPYKKPTLVPVSYSISMGGLLLPENPNIYRSFQGNLKLAAHTSGLATTQNTKLFATKLGRIANAALNMIMGTNKDWNEVVFKDRLQISAVSMINDITTGIWATNPQQVVDKLPGDQFVKIRKILKGL